ncbi:MAG: hypothetical protein DRQ44_18555 [Gammaproteobacteria bacterium]|nr:MAG: hypothetical protein DRQ44_18555 [Gammaproteobacteria bacterium]
MAIISATLEENQVLSIKDLVDAALPIPPYNCIGRYGMLKQHKIDGFPTDLVMQELSKDASHLFWNLVHLRDIETNIAYLPSSNLPKHKKDKLYKAYKELEKKVLVVRYKQENYLINPKAVLPMFKGFDRVWDLWVGIRVKKLLEHNYKPN